MDVDFLIVGQGLAGSILAHELLETNHRVCIVNDVARKSSSMVAGGMFNPVTGKTLTETWLAGELFPYLKEFYQTIERKFDTNFFHETNLYRPFANEQQKKQFLNILADKTRVSEKYINTEPSNIAYETFIHNALGGIYTQSAGWVDVPNLLKHFKNYFVSKEIYREEFFDYTCLTFDENVVYKDILAKKIIFAEGFYATQNPYFSWLPFNAVKGETLLVEMEKYDIPEIVNQGSWILPMNKNHFRMGATYSWHALDFIPTEEGQRYLKEKIHKFLKVPFRVIKQEAGVRPATKDRRPFIGEHPKNEKICIFNGFGTKGVSLIPYFAKEFTENLLNKKEINPEATIQRLYALYIE